MSRLKHEDSNGVNNMNIILLALSLSLYNKFYHYLIIIVTINLTGLNAVPPSVLRIRTSC
jgi:hypothetical protein